MDNFKRMFAPESLAIIGASRHEGSLGKMFLNAVLKMHYKGKIYLVNPKANNIETIKCYSNISDLPEIPDLAVILLPKKYVHQSVELLGRKGIKNVIVVSAGFREIGKTGMKLEMDLIQLAHKYNMRLIGPNSMGFFNTDPHVSLNATFSPTLPSTGPVAFISQSGALGVGVLELSKNMGLGFSLFVSTGNKADVGDVEVLQYLKKDTNTKVIILYQESLDKVVEFRKTCLSIIPKKPVLSLKAGRTESGLRAASSHTGSLASNDAITDAFLAQCGVIRCQTLQELLDSALSFAYQPLPSGNRIAVITNAGGPGILASDAIEHMGLRLADLEKQTIIELTSFLPDEAGLNNPIDMIASATHVTYQKVCSLVEKDKNVNAIFLIIVKPPVDTTPVKIIKQLSSIIKNSNKPFFCTLMVNLNDPVELKEFLDLGIPVYQFPEAAARALGNMLRYKELKEHLKIDSKTFTDWNIASAQAKSKEIKQVPYDNIICRLEKFKLPFCPYVIVENVEAAVRFQREHGSVVLKIANEEIVHKSELDLVKLNLSTPRAVKTSFADILVKSSQYLPSQVTPRILVQKMVTDGIELVLGAKRDPHFGPTIMFGIGGIFIELYKDVVFRVLPVGYKETKRMINEIQGINILKGFRNYPKVNLNTMAQIVVKFAELISAYRDIHEMDLNPIIWPKGASNPVIVDCRMTVST